MTSTTVETNAQLIREVQGVLDETLSLGHRAYELQPNSPLFGSLPELDSQAVLHVLLGLEERLGITIDDDDVDAEAFETLASLVGMVAGKLESQ